MMEESYPKSQGLRQFIRYKQYNKQNLTMQQSRCEITDKYRRELKTQDFVIVHQENKQYKQIIKVIKEQQIILEGRIKELQKMLEKSENQKDEYKSKYREISTKLHYFDSIKQELFDEFAALRQQVQKYSNQSNAKQQVINSKQQKIQDLQMSLLEQQQHSKTNFLIIDELRQYIAKLQRQLVQKKITIFGNMVGAKYDDQIAKTIKKQNQMQKSNMKPQKLNKSQCASLINSMAANNSDFNSISFSFASDESSSRRKASIKKHNKSIYI